jgi:hypothetical protein
MSRERHGPQPRAIVPAMPLYEAPPDERRCLCATPIRDRVYFSTWVCRLCAQPIKSGVKA